MTITEKQAITIVQMIGANYEAGDADDTLAFRLIQALEKLEPKAALEDRDEPGAIRAKVRKDNLEDHLGNLLARIHRDGGQYQAEHGTDKACADAEKIIANLYAGTPRLPYPKVIDLVQACVIRMQAAGESHRMLARWISEGLDKIPASEQLTWTSREGNYPGQRCWDTQGYWIVRQNGETQYSLNDLEIADIPGCSPHLGLFDTLEAAMLDAERRHREDQIA